MADGSTGSSPDELRRALQEHAGLNLVALTPTADGESHSAFWARDSDGTVSLLKIMPGATPEATGHLHALDAVLARLRDREYPAPRFRGIGYLPGLVFWFQQLLPGAALDRGGGEPDHAALARLLPGLLRLNDAQADLGTGTDSWATLITGTLMAGGDGYCLHATLQAHSSTRDLLQVLRRIGDRCCAAIPAGRDFIHYDFTPANLLSDGTAITGVIDINPPVLAGDRAFDLATLLFYGYDHDDLREPLRSRLLELSGPRAACAYLAHLVLRQVDWSLRHHPAAAATRRHLRLAELVITDINHSPARW
ncbi:MAG: aminoglycoside phosphotransferase family protein [Actinomycetota bacterium]|nr:aminoglycoside phosphotransferase family protein [Actinomycetota bacterium]